MNQKAEIERMVAVLVGTPLWICRRTADVFSFHFGQKQKTTTFMGELVDVGEYALNVQCAWRITRRGRVAVGSGDLRRHPRSEVRHMRSKMLFDQSPPLCDELLGALFEPDQQQYIVRKVEGGVAASLHIAMDEDLALDVLPDYTADDEYWRLFKPIGSGSPVIATGGSSRRE